MATVAVFPGSFDPPTLGHLGVVERAAALVDRVVIAVATNTSKTPLFSVDERVRLWRESVEGLTGVEVVRCPGLVVDFAAHVGADVIVKGVRGAADVDSELAQADLNERLGGIPTVFIPPAAGMAGVSSSMIKEVARLGGDVSPFVPAPVARALAQGDHHND